jgi:periplasmic divalent cation tolerance protein
MASGSYPGQLRKEGDKTMNHTADVPVIILSTASPDNAKAIARALVGERIAACVNMTEVSSYYHWKGEFCDDTETLLIIKTMDSRKIEVMDAIRHLHTYELPEMIVIPITGGFPPYLSWLNEELVQDSPSH